MSNKQEDFWSGEFGQEYTDRNFLTTEQWEQYYKDCYGITRLEMNEKFVGSFPKDIRILEVGCNIGMQLRGLKQMGFQNLYGIEIQHKAVEMSKEVCPGANVIQGSAFDLPFKSSFFDVVVTNGVLIHIAPENHRTFMKEVHRCSSKFIWGFEYFNEETVEINYRANEGFLWKADFARIYRDFFTDLTLTKEEKYPYIKEVESGNTDVMFLLEKIEQ